MERTTLFYRQGSSDKEYQANIAAQGDGYVVQYAYGRRGTTLQTGCKTQAPVPLEQARQIYRKLVSEKQAKGYTPGESGTPYQHSDKQASGIRCQLLNAVDEATAHRLVYDPAFCLQEKLDGRRLLLRKTGNKVEAINRLGLVVGVPQCIAAAAVKLTGDYVIDGEAVGETLHAFDLLTANGTDVRSQSYSERFGKLVKLAGKTSAITVVESATTITEKALAFCTLKAMNAEGVVFKELSAPYTGGRPSSGGPQLKYKFVATASFIVGQLNARRSVSLRLYRSGELVAAGNVTIPPNHEIPTTGAVVEVRYLYAFPESGCIYQPVYLGIRDDITPAECVVGQLKYKEAR